MDRSLSALLAAAGIRADVSSDAQALAVAVAVIRGLAYDSRAVGAGDLFCCIPGVVVDGHDFAGQAAAAGAAALLVERAVDTSLPVARVERVRPVLGPLADAFFEHPSGEIPVVAVTGTNGKTTVTYLVESIARSGGYEPGLIGTVSRRFLGHEEPAPRNTPEAIDLQALLRRMRDAGVNLIVMEATSDGLAQERLRSTRFATAAFTNLTRDHLNTHGSMEAYFEAKASLFARSYTERAVVNIGDPYGRRIYDRVHRELEVVTYGDPDADIALVSSNVTATESVGRFRTPSGEIDVRTTLRGHYNLDNCACAIGIGLHVGLGLDRIGEGLSLVSTVPGRLEPIDSGRGFVVLVDYAHTPDALENALRACRELTAGRVIVVFGCGGDRDRAKRPLMGEAATSAADLAIITSDNPRSEDPLAIIEEIRVGASRGTGEYRLIPDRRDAIGEALRAADAGDVVLVAGKGHEQGQTFADRTIPFDDRDVVRELAEELPCRS